MYVEQTRGPVRIVFVPRISRMAFWNSSRVCLKKSTFSAGTCTLYSGLYRQLPWLTPRRKPLVMTSRLTPTQPRRDE